MQTLAFGVTQEVNIKGKEKSNKFLKIQSTRLERGVVEGFCLFLCTGAVVGLISVSAHTPFCFLSRFLCLPKAHAVYFVPLLCVYSILKDK